LRLGGGFMLTQGTKLILPRRTMDAPRPGQFCECAGVFERVESGEDEDFGKDFIASLLKESQEILIARGDTLYVPQLAQYPAVQVGFQPPSRLDNYNRIIMDEVRKELEKFKELCPDDFPEWLGNEKNWKKFWMKLLDYERSVRLQFAYSPEISVEITAEIDNSSLECVGVLSLPDDIDKAVEAYERGNTPQDKWKSMKAELGLPKKGELEYWDIEEGKPETFEDPETGRKFAVAAPAHRDVYRIDLERCHEERGVVVWHFEGKGKRDSRLSNLWRELSDTCIGAEAPKEEKDKGERGKPGGTGGRFATEKLEKAIKMHCPYPSLQPLVRL
jgi:hypothetical protein